MSSNARKFVVYAAMRNEGAFIVEWVTWYKMLGFEVLVGSNDCTDHSPQLLDKLAEHGWLTHAPHKPQKDQPPKTSAHRSARKHPMIADADWLLICDVDEFLVLHLGDGSIQDFIGDDTPDFMGLAFSWRCFGDGGNQTYQDGLVHRQFNRSGFSNIDVNRPFKTLFRQPTRFYSYGAHVPRGFDGEWGGGENRWINSAGRELYYIHPNEPPVRRLKLTDINHETAQMNHYVIRSDESFRMKMGRPSASSLKDRYTNRFHKRFNRNAKQEDTARRYDTQFDALYAQAMALPGIRKLHHQCCADYVRSLCDYQNIDPTKDSRYQHHLNMAVDS